MTNAYRNRINTRHNLLLPAVASMAAGLVAIAASMGGSAHTDSQQATASPSTLNNPTIGKSFDYYNRTMNLSRITAAVLTAGEMYESRAQPSFRNETSEGIMAWGTHYYGWQGVIDFATETHQDPHTLTTQLEYVDQQLRSPRFAPMVKQMEAAPDVQTATEIFTSEYLKPAFPNIIERDAYANRIMTNY